MTAQLVGVLIAMAGLLIVLVGKIFAQGEQMGAQARTLALLEVEVKGLREKYHHLSDVVQWLTGIEEARSGNHFR